MKYEDNKHTDNMVVQGYVFDISRNQIFPISYEAARIMVIKSGKLVGVKLRPHGLRRHSATYASRSGVSICCMRRLIILNLYT